MEPRGLRLSVTKGEGRKINDRSEGLRKAKEKLFEHRRRGKMM